MDEVDGGCVEVGGDEEDGPALVVIGAVDDVTDGPLVGAPEAGDVCADDPGALSDGDGAAEVDAT